MNDFEENVGHWVQALWNFNSGDGKPFPDDEAFINSELGNGVIAECVGIEGEYVRLRAKGRLFRLRPFSLVNLPAPPKFRWGESVRVVAHHPTHSPYRSKIKSFSWHFKNNGYIYFLDGKSKRYDEADLETDRV